MAIALAAPLAAQAQTITSPFASSTTTGQSGIVYIGKSLCSSTTQIDFVVNWQGNPPTQGVDNVSFWLVADAGTCTKVDDPTGTGNHLLSTPATFGSASQTVLVSMTTLAQDVSGGCGNTTFSAAAPFNEYFCVRRKQTLISTTVTAVSMQVSFALVPPKSPSAPTVTAGDSHLVLSWASNDNGDNNYDVYAFTSAAAADPNRPASRNIVGKSFDLSSSSDGGGLVNGTTYFLFVRSNDLFGNSSNLSSPAAQGTPIPIDDFYNRYRSAGGSALGGGGCASGGADLVAALSAVAVLVWRRRSRMALLAAGIAAAPAAPAAEHWSGIDREPRRLLVAFKMDRYDPQIDSEFGGAGPHPYHDIFRGRAPPRYQIEVDWEVAHPFGSILVGGTLGFWQNYGHGIIASSGVPSADGATLNVVPIGAVVTYRFDALADRYRWFPIVPYVQAGLQTAFWASLNGTGHVTTSRYQGGRGSGWSYGYTTALGVALSLDAIDARLAREAYNDTGIQRTSLFAEYGWTRLDNFRKGGALILSDRAWRFGLSVEF
jgi:hypothetical protein